MFLPDTLSKCKQYPLVIKSATKFLDEVMCVGVSACLPGSSTSHPQSISMIQEGCFAAALWAAVWFQSLPWKMKARRSPVLKHVRYFVTVKMYLNSCYSI